jgi:hypothetical protein
MALQSSGQIDISDIKAELGSTSGSLRTLSAAAGLTSPDAMSEFYGYSSFVEPDEYLNISNWTGNGGTKSITGKIGQSAEFNGSSSRINLPNNPINGKTSVSAAFWLNSANPTRAVHQYLLSFVNSISGWEGVGIRLTGTPGKIGIVRAKSGAVTVAENSSYTVVANTWVHVAVTCSQSQAKIYINGSLDSTHSVSGFTTNNTGSFDIGMNQYNASTTQAFFHGELDEIYVYGDILSSTEVGYIYNNTTASIPSDNLLAYYKFNGNAEDEQGSYDGTPTNVGFVGMKFQPDLVWIKGLDNTWDHLVFDVTRGGNKYLKANETSAESGVANWISYPSGGFKLTSVGGAVNQNGEKFVSYNFKAGGTASANNNGVTSGSVTAVTSTVSANVGAGFSINKFTTPSSGFPSWGHGLSSAPELIAVKATGLTQNWAVYAPSLLGQKAAQFNTSSAFTAYSPNIISVNSSKIDLGRSGYGLSGNSEYIAYCFHSVPGLSKIGTYVGNGSLTGPTVTTGFKPRFLILKSTSHTGHWVLMDAVREAGRNDILYAYTLFSISSYASIDGYPGTKFIQLNSNGFQLKTNSTSFNGNARSYMYYAVA